MSGSIELKDSDHVGWFFSQNNLLATVAIRPAVAYIKVRVMDTRLAPHRYLCTTSAIAIDRYFVGFIGHDLEFSTACLTPSISFWFLRDRLPYNRAEKTVMISSTSFAKSSSNVVSSP